MAAKEGRELVKEAVKDAKSLKEAAIAAAKNELVESMAPQLRAILEKSLKGALESVDRVNSQGSDYYSPGSREKEKKYQEGKAKGDQPMADKDDKEPEKLDLESLAGFFPQLAEEPDADPDADPNAEDEGAMPPMGGMSGGGMGGGMGAPHEMAGDHGDEEDPMSAQGHKAHEVDEDPYE